MFEIQSPKTWQAEVQTVLTLEQMQVRNGTGPEAGGVSVLYCLVAPVECSMETSEISL